MYNRMNIIIIISLKYVCLRCIFMYLVTLINLSINIYAINLILVNYRQEYLPEYLYTSLFALGSRYSS